VNRFGDSMEIPVTLGEGESATTEKLRVGDLRAQLGQTLSAYENDRLQKQQQISALEQTLRALNTANAPAASRQEHPRTPAGLPSDDDLDADPWVRKIMDRVRREISDNAQTLRGEHKGFEDLTRGGVAAQTKLLLRTIANQEFARLDGWPKDYDPARAFQEAGNRGYIDKSTGLPDLARLHHDLTEDSRIELRAKALAEKMREDDRKVESEKNQSRFNRLGVPGAIRANSKKEAKKYNTLQEFLMDDANLPTDAEIERMGIMGAMVR